MTTAASGWPWATELIIKYQDRWIAVAIQIITAISPQVGPLGGAGLGPLALTRIQLRHRRFIGMQYGTSAE